MKKSTLHSILSILNTLFFKYNNVDYTITKRENYQYCDVTVWKNNHCIVTETFILSKEEELNKLKAKFTKFAEENKHLFIIK